MLITHKKAFGIYPRDTFDNEIFSVDEADTLKEAVTLVQKHYGDRIFCLDWTTYLVMLMREDGADQVNIVDQKGNIVQCFKVG